AVRPRHAGCRSLSSPRSRCWTGSGASSGTTQGRSMEFLYNLTVVTHMLGLAALVRGYLVAVTHSTEGLVPNTVMVWGARVQLLTGLILVGLAEGALDYEVNQTKIGVKLVVAIAVAALTEIAAARAR